MTDKERIEIWNKGFYFALWLVEVKVRRHKKEAQSALKEKAYIDILEDIDYIQKDRKEDMEMMEFDEDGNLIVEDKK